MNEMNHNEFLVKDFNFAMHQIKEILI